MALSRQQQNDYKQLKKNTETLLAGQRDVLERAAAALRRASRQARHFTSEEVSPRVHDTYQDHLLPAVGRGVAVTKRVASAGREKLSDDVVPAVTNAVATAIAVLDMAKNPEVRAAISRANKGVNKVGVKVGIVTPHKSGPAKYILIGLGVVAVAGVAYAAWQTLRADDSLWIEDEPEELELESEQEEL